MQITEEQLKEWEDFLTHQTCGSMNYAYVAMTAFKALSQAYREQQKEIERLKKEYERLELYIQGCLV